MEEDVHTPGNILFTQDYGIKTTDGVTTTTIAGSASRSGSYREGTGSDASFTYLRGFAQISGTKQVITIHYLFHNVSYTRDHFKNFQDWSWMSQGFYIFNFTLVYFCDYMLKLHFIMPYNAVY